MSLNSPRYACLSFPKAVSRGPMCWNFDGFQDRPQSEDCLTLDVHAPSPLPSSPLPVVFWIYGGSNIMGSSDAYPGLPSLVHGVNAIVVAPNYRLGLFGPPSSPLPSSPSSLITQVIYLLNIFLRETLVE